MIFNFYLKDNENDETEFFHDEEVYEERFKNDIENQLKMKIIDGSTPMKEPKTKRLPNNEDEFLLENFDEFYEIANQNERMKLYYLKKIYFISNRKDFVELKRYTKMQNKSLIKAQNKLDQNIYLIKRIHITQESLAIWEKHIRGLMSLHHENLIRYYQVIIN